MSDTIAGLCTGRSCHCDLAAHTGSRVVLTGGPGAGKTAVLEIVRRSLCSHVAVLPEAASVVFGGGFLRRHSPAGRRGAQRAIFHVQREMEGILAEEETNALVLCDRGTVDGSAYWPGSEATFWSETGTTREKEILRYDQVIHLHSPTAGNGYNYQNPIRIETAEQAADIDARIANAWRGHPSRHFIESTESFLDKARAAVKLILRSVPECCLK